MRKETMVLSGLAVLLFGGTAAAEQPEWVGKTRPEIRRHHIQGGGSWRAHGRKQRSLQRWSLNVERGDDGRIYGSVDVGDSELLSAGRVVGMIKGRHLTGTISEEGGEPIAKVYGAVTADGVRGTYVDRTGGTGEWIWDGPVPE